MPDTFLFSGAADNPAGGAPFVPVTGIYSTADTPVFTSKVTGDTFPRLTVKAGNGFGFSNGFGAQDVDLYRDSPGILRTSTNFVAGGAIGAAYTAGAQTFIGARGPGGESGLEFGVAADLVLYRLGVSTAQLSGALFANSTLAAAIGQTTGQVAIGQRGPASQAGIDFGTAAAEKIYRAATGQLACTAAMAFTTAANSFIGGVEMPAAPAAPGADGWFLYAVDVAGKTQLQVRFSSGAVQILATQP